MPLPMVHLSVAHRLADTLPEPLDLGAFYLGNIAPDAIHMREGTTRDDKQYTHFYPEQEDNYTGRLQKFYGDYISERKSEGWTSFVTGYFMHVMTDYYWFRSVYPAFEEQVREQDQCEGAVRTKEDLARLYYKETDQIDFNLYRTMNWSEEVWSALNNSSGYEMADRLTADEIIRWRDRTFSFYMGKRRALFRVTLPKRLYELLSKKQSHV